MDASIKSREYTLVNKNLELLSTKVIHQFGLVEELLMKEWKEDIYKQILENENIIDDLEVQTVQKLPNLVILFAPKATELRKIVSCHEVILSLEQIGDFLLDIIDLLKKLNLSSPDYNDFKQTLRKMIVSSREITNASAYSFFKNNSKEAYKILHKGNDIDVLSKELSENLSSSFQEMNLTAQELLNIISLKNISYVIERIKNNARNVAKSTIFATEGIDIRHQHLDK